MRIKHWFYTAPLRLRSLLRRAQVEWELDEELRYHLERQIEENIAKGMAPEEARYAALRAMGGLERRKEECRDMRRVKMIEDLMPDLRYGLRTLRKSPGFTGAALVILAVGIGSVGAIFSVVNGVVLKPLPYSEPDRLARIYGVWPQGSREGISPPDFFDYRSQVQTLESVAVESAFAPMLSLSGNEQPVQLSSPFQGVWPKCILM